MVSLLAYHVWLDVYQDELEGVDDKYAAYNAYRDSFYEAAVDSTLFELSH